MNTGTPYRVALIRGILGAVLMGASTLLATWTVTDDPKTLIIATATVIVSQLLYRFGFEGSVDNAQAANAMTFDDEAAIGAPPAAVVGPLDQAGARVSELLERGYQAAGISTDTNPRGDVEAVTIRLKAPRA